MIPARPTRFYRDRVPPCMSATPLPFWATPALQQMKSRTRQSGARSCEWSRTMSSSWQIQQGLK